MAGARVTPPPAAIFCALSFQSSILAILALLAMSSLRLLADIEQDADARQHDEQ